MNARRTIADLLSLAAGLHAWALELVAWLAAWFGDGPLGAPLGRWMARELGRAERFAVALVVLAALQVLPAPPPLRTPAGRRPASAPRGFAWSRGGGNDMRPLRRRLFPRERDVRRRVRRLAAVLGALMEKARRLAPRIACCPPTCTLLPVAPPADASAPQDALPAPPAFNSS